MKMTASNKTQLLVVVNGVEIPVDANLNAPLRTVAQHALNATGNSGRPLSEWELKNDAGVLLDLDKPVGSFGFGPHTVLYLTVSVGVNGFRTRRDGL
jgi:hypothetical protein